MYARVFTSHRENGRADSFVRSALRKYAFILFHTFIPPRFSLAKGARARARARARIVCPKCIICEENEQTYCLKRFDLEEVGYAVHAEFSLNLNCPFLFTSASFRASLPFFGRRNFAAGPKFHANKVRSGILIFSE